MADQNDGYFLSRCLGSFERVSCFMSYTRASLILELDETQLQDLLITLQRIERLLPDLNPVKCATSILIGKENSHDWDHLWSCFHRGYDSCNK